MDLPHTTHNHTLFYPPPSGIAGLSQGFITSSAFRTYHTPLNSQPDFINALAAARRFAETASSELGLQVGGQYSVHFTGTACSLPTGHSTCNSSPTSEHAAPHHRQQQQLCCHNHSSFFHAFSCIHAVAAAACTDTAGYKQQLPALTSPDTAPRASSSQQRASAC